MVNSELSNKKKLKNLAYFKKLKVIAKINVEKIKEYLYIIDLITVKTVSAKF